MKLGNAISRFRTADLKLRKMLAEFEDQRNTFVVELPGGENYLSRYSGEDMVALAINGNEKGEHGNAFNTTLHLERTADRLNQLSAISKQHDLAEGYLQDMFDIKEIALDIKDTLARERVITLQKQAEKAREEARLRKKERLAKVKEDRIREQVEKEVRARLAEEAEKVSEVGEEKAREAAEDTWDISPRETAEDTWDISPRETPTHTVEGWGAGAGGVGVSLCETVSRMTLNTQEALAASNEGDMAHFQGLVGASSSPPSPPAEFNEADLTALEAEYPGGVLSE